MSATPPTTVTCRTCLSFSDAITCMVFSRS